MQARKGALHSDCQQNELGSGISARQEFGERYEGKGIGIS